MSKIGRKPIILPEGVTVTKTGDSVKVENKGRIVTVSVLSGVSFEVKDKQIVLTSHTDTKQGRANWGTMRALLQNAVRGVAQDFKKVLELEGIGFKAALEGKTLVMSLGFSHPVKYDPPAGVELKVEKNTITISGSDKALVGAVAATIRAFRKPEPYKGKGIKYQGEVIRRKEGKKVGATTGAA